MKCKMDKEITVLPSLCDNTAKLSVPSIVSLLVKENGKVAVSVKIE